MSLAQQQTVGQTQESSLVSGLQQKLNELREVAPDGDIQALLSKIAELESEKAVLSQTLHQANGKVEKLTEKTKIDMQEKLTGMISSFVKDLPNATQEKKDEFMKGLERLVNNTAEDSGIWQVVCCASEAHANNVVALEAARKENEELKQRLNGGSFAMPQARMEIDNGKKRKADVIASGISASGISAGGSAAMASEGGKVAFWDDFAVMLQREHESNGYTNHHEISAAVK